MTERIGWICSKCERSLNPVLQECPVCTLALGTTKSVSPPERCATVTHAPKKEGRKPALPSQDKKTALIYQLQLAASQLGHTPTKGDMSERGYGIHLFKCAFGTYAKAIESARLVVRVGSRGEAPSLPEGFPTKDELTEARMPWPKEYFGLRSPKCATPLN